MILKIKYCVIHEYTKKTGRIGVCPTLPVFYGFLLDFQGFFGFKKSVFWLIYAVYQTLRSLGKRFITMPHISLISSGIVPKGPFIGSYLKTFLSYLKRQLFASPVT